MGPSCAARPSVCSLMAPFGESNCRRNPCEPDCGSPRKANSGSVCAGLLSALLGIGSGVLKIPAMDTALRLPIKVSSATSNFMIGVTAAASAGAYFMRGAIVPEIAGPVALGSVVGALLGARLLVFISPSKLRLVFVAVLLVLAVQMTLAALGIHEGLPT